MTSQKFQPGDLVTKLYGKKPAEITTICNVGHYYGTQYQLRYIKSDGRAGTSFYEYERNLKLYTPPQEKTMANTLYTFEENGKTLYASVIGKTENGMLVLEAKGGAGIFTKPESEVKEVIPYTIDISWGGLKSISYEATKGALIKGDVVLNSNGDIGVVRGVDTKCKTARAAFKGRKVVTEEI